MKFVFDLDGTICFQGQPISSKIVQSLSALHNSGMEVIFASARPVRDMLPVIDEAFHHCTMIGGNGSLIYKEGKLVKSHSFSINAINEIKKLIDQYRAAYLIDGVWNYAYTGPDDHPILQNLDPANLAEKVALDSLQPIVKVLILSSNDMEQLCEQLLKLDVYVHVHSNENVLDISPSGINKWSALNSLGVKDKSYVAFGNDANDTAMFEHALHTVMIGDHRQLASLANEKIPLSGDYEQEIADKIRMLSEKYR